MIILWMDARCYTIVRDLVFDFSIRWTLLCRSLLCEHCQIRCPWQGFASVLHFNLYFVSKRFDGMLIWVEGVFVSIPSSCFGVGRYFNTHGFRRHDDKAIYFSDNMTSYSAHSRLQDYARDSSALCDFHARISQVVGADSSSTPLSCIVLLACDWYRPFPPLSRSNSTVRGGTWTECTSVELLLSSGGVVLSKRLLTFGGDLNEHIVRCARDSLLGSRSFSAPAEHARRVLTLDEAALCIEAWLLHLNELWCRVRPHRELSCLGVECFRLRVRATRSGDVFNDSDVASFATSRAEC